MTTPFIVFEAELPWIYPLAVELGSIAPYVVAISLGATAHPFQRRIVNWPYDNTNEQVQKEVWSYPPGFNRKMRFCFDYFIKARLNKCIEKICEKTGSNPFIIVPNPRLYQYVREIDNAQIIYLVYDDYSVDCTTGAHFMNPHEDALVNESVMILCSSDFMRNSFRKRFPSCKKKVFHFPHGVNKDFVNNCNVNSSLHPSVSVVGYLGCRYDWVVIEKVVSALQDVEFYFVGDIREDTFVGEFEQHIPYLRRVLASPNVKHMSGIEHKKTKEYYWASAVNWMPYRVDMPFVQASCPLKISDGLASGRQIVSADVPECRLYPEWIRIYRDEIEAVLLIRQALDHATSSRELDRVQRQISFANANTWQRRASWLLSELDKI